MNIVAWSFRPGRTREQLHRCSQRLWRAYYSGGMIRDDLRLAAQYAALAAVNAAVGGGK